MFSSPWRQNYPHRSWESTENKWLPHTKDTISIGCDGLSFPELPLVVCQVQEGVISRFITWLLREYPFFLLPLMRWRLGRETHARSESGSKLALWLQFEQHSELSFQVWHSLLSGSGFRVELVGIFSEILTPDTLGLVFPSSPDV